MSNNLILFLTHIHHSKVQSVQIRVPIYAAYRSLRSILPDRDISRVCTLLIPLCYPVWVFCKFRIDKIVFKPVSDCVDHRLISEFSYAIAKCFDNIRTLSGRDVAVSEPCARIFGIYRNWKVKFDPVKYTDRVIRFLYGFLFRYGLCEKICADFYPPGLLLLEDLLQRICQYKVCPIHRNGLPDEPSQI